MISNRRIVVYICNGLIGGVLARSILADPHLRANPALVPHFDAANFAMSHAIAFIGLIALIVGTVLEFAKNRAAGFVNVGVYSLGVMMCVTSILVHRGEHPQEEFLAWFVALLLTIILLIVVWAYRKKPKSGWRSLS